jgi:hypothetical protein
MNGRVVALVFPSDILLLLRGLGKDNANLDSRIRVWVHGILAPSSRPRRRYGDPRSCAEPRLKREDLPRIELLGPFCREAVLKCRHCFHQFSHCNLHYFIIFTETRQRQPIAMADQPLPIVPGGQTYGATAAIGNRRRHMAHDLGVRSPEFPELCAVQAPRSPPRAGTRTLVARSACLPYWGQMVCRAFTLLLNLRSNFGITQATLGPPQ